MQHNNESAEWDARTTQRHHAMIAERKKTGRPMHHALGRQARDRANDIKVRVHSGQIRKPGATPSLFESPSGSPSGSPASLRKMGFGSANTEGLPSNGLGDSPRGSPGMMRRAGSGGSGGSGGGGGGGGGGGSGGGGRGGLGSAVSSGSLTSYENGLSGGMQPAQLAGLFRASVDTALPSHLRSDQSGDMGDNDTGDEAYGTPPMDHDDDDQMHQHSDGTFNGTAAADDEDPNAPFWKTCDANQARVLLALLVFID
jgi:hypothetical protein